MTEQPKQWVQNPRWLRTESGDWINREAITSVCARSQSQEKWCLEIETINGRGYVLIEGFETQEEAQQHLDKLQIFYDLKPYEEPVTVIDAV